MTLLEAIASSTLFAPFFAGAEWAAWRAFLAALFAHPMSEAEAELYRQCTGRQDAPAEPAREATVIVGRRGGKSRIAALVAVFLACFRNYRDVLAAGEVGTLPIIAADRRQARTIMQYVNALLDGVPLLARLVEHRTAESVTLATRCRIEVHTASFRSVRGYTIVAAVLDEVSFWRSEDSANPDTEVLNALRPAMATVPGALLLAISSPYARRGVLWEAYRRHFGKAGAPVLVWQADTRTMNPCVPPHVIATAYETDEVAAAAEYGAQFRRDVESYVTREAVEGATIPGRFGLPPVTGVAYSAFVDPSGGSVDSMTLAIGHAEERDGHRVAIVDYLAERRAPFSPESVVAECAAMLKSYRLSRVSGDRYAGEWPREAFHRHGVTYDPAALSKSELYAAFLPLLNSGRVELLDHTRLHAQLLGLERRTARGGRDTIDHAPNAHDDVANAVAGVCAGLAHARHGLFELMRQEYERLHAPAVPLTAAHREADVRVT